MIQVIARAKVNLSLEVLGRRNDGYQEVATVMQAIALADDLLLRPATGLVLETNDPSLDTEDNLVLRAARLLKEETGSAEGAHLVLVKRIPAGAGLGGGSSDAAAALMGLARLWGLAVSHDRLSELGARIGSDVPFFLSEEGTAVARGRGERIEPLPSAPPGWVVIAVPAVTRPDPKTGSMFQRIRAVDMTDGVAADRWLRALASGRPSWSSLRERADFVNAFQGVAPASYPGWETALDTFRAVAGRAPASMSGTGPALFAVYDDRHEAGEAHWALMAAGLRSIITETADRPITLV